MAMPRPNGKPVAKMANILDISMETPYPLIMTSKPPSQKPFRPRVNYADRRRKAKPAVSSRQIVQDLMQEIIGKGLPLQDALNQHDGWNKLDDRDRRFARRLITMVLRHHGAAKAILKSQMTKPLNRRDRKAEAILIMAVVELIWAESDSHAAVDQAVRLMRNTGFRHLTGLANGVLRNIDRRRDAIKSTPQDPMVNAPTWLQEALTQDWGDDASRIMESLLQAPALDIRPKEDVAAWAEKLGGIATPHGSIRLAETPSKGRLVNALEGYDDGAWWVQDSAASLPAMLLGDIQGKRVIDCCAAPGGKTAQLIAAGADVIALDQSAERMKILNANMTRLKMTPEIVIADGMTHQMGDDLVDAVLLDAPCSATGTIRRRPDILSHQKAPDLAMLNRLQHGLLAQAATWLKPGGVLVYVTCSILKDEGEKIIQSAPPSLKPVPITSDDAPGFSVTNTNGDAIRLMPDALQLTPQNSGLQDPEDLDTRGNIPQGNDGFFIAKFIKV